MDRDTGGKRRRNKKGRMTSGLAALVWLLCGVCAAAVVRGAGGGRTHCFHSLCRCT